MVQKGICSNLLKCSYIFTKKFLDIEFRYTNIVNLSENEKKEDIFANHLQRNCILILFCYINSTWNVKDKPSYIEFCRSHKT